MAAGTTDDVVETVASEIALQVRPLARAGFGRHDPAGRPDTAGGEKRVIAVIGADIDKHHAGPQHPVQEGEFVGLE